MILAGHFGTPRPVRLGGVVVVVVGRGRRSSGSAVPVGRAAHRILRVAVADVGPVWRVQRV